MPHVTRIIQIPLSGGDRKAQAKGIRQAHGLDASYYAESVMIRSAAEAKLRQADRLECDAWNAINVARRAGDALATRLQRNQTAPTSSTCRGWEDSALEVLRTLVYVIVGLAVLNALVRFVVRWWVRYSKWP
jgi:hypothetical protein